MLIAGVGDSWLDYPGADVLTMLEGLFRYDVVSCAHRGDTLEEMAYDHAQGRKLGRLFSSIKAQGRRPDAVLISAGGNDIAGDELALLLNHARTPLPAVNDRVVAGVMERLGAAYRSLLFGVTGLSRVFFKEPVPIAVHGYAYPVPDGRGFMGGFGILPGPWLRPALLRKGHGDLELGVQIMRGLIDALYTTLASVASTPGLEHVRCVDLRCVLAAEPGHHQVLWADELHPTARGFGLVASAIDQALMEAA